MVRYGLPLSKWYDSGDVINVAAETNTSKTLSESLPSILGDVFVPNFIFFYKLSLTIQLFLLHRAHHLVPVNLVLNPSLTMNPNRIGVVPLPHHPNLILTTKLILTLS
jgi:hypothetical protein